MPCRKALAIELERKNAERAALKVGQTGTMRTEILGKAKEMADGRRPPVDAAAGVKAKAKRSKREANPIRLLDPPDPERSARLLAEALAVSPEERRAKFRDQAKQMVAGHMAMEAEWEQKQRGKEQECGSVSQR